MEFILNVPEYSEKTGIKFDWEAGFDIKVTIVNNEVVISANKEGLISLAKHLLVLAQDGVPVGHHLHLDEYNALEDDSSILIVEKR